VACTSEKTELVDVIISCMMKDLESDRSVEFFGATNEVNLTDYLSLTGECGKCTGSVTNLNQIFSGLFRLAILDFVKPHAKTTVLPHDRAFLPSVDD